MQKIKTLHEHITLQQYTCYGQHPTKSLIKHDVFKFCGDYEVVLALIENGLYSANVF